MRTEAAQCYKLRTSDDSTSDLSEEGAQVSIDNTRAILISDRLYFATISGIGRASKSGDGLKLFPFDPDLNASEVRALEEVDGKLWLITRNAGIRVFDPSSEKFAETFYIGQKTEFGYNANMAVVEDDANAAIWFSHFLNVDRYDRKTKEWKNLNSEIARVGIGQPGSSPGITIRMNGIWISNGSHAKSSGGTMHCDVRGSGCKMAVEEPPPATEEKYFDGCPISARSQFSVCEQKIIERKGTNTWLPIMTALPAFDFPVNRYEKDGRQGPVVACRDNRVLMVANGALQIFDGETLGLTSVAGGETFVLDGYWGTEYDGDLLAISKDYEGGDGPSQPSQYFAFDWKSTQLVKRSSGPFSGQMEHPGPECDLSNGKRFTATGAGIKLTHASGQSVAQSRRVADQDAAVASLDMYEMFPDQPDFNQAFGIEGIVALSRDLSEKEKLLLRVFKGKGGPYARFYARCHLIAIYDERGEAAKANEQLTAIQESRPEARDSTRQACIAALRATPRTVRLSNDMPKEEKIRCGSAAHIRIVVMPHVRRWQATSERVKRYFRGDSTIEQAYRDVSLALHVGEEAKRALSQLPVGVQAYASEVQAMSLRTIAEDSALASARQQHIDERMLFLSRFQRRLQSKDPKLGSISIFGPGLTVEMQKLDEEARKLETGILWGEIPPCP